MVCFLSTKLWKRTGQTRHGVPRNARSHTPPCNIPEGRPVPRNLRHKARMRHKARNGIHQGDPPWPSWSCHGGVRGYLTRKKRHHGFSTGDMVVADVPGGKKAGVYVGRVAVRATGSFNIQTGQGTVQGIHHRHCRVVQRADGYGYTHHPKPEGPLSLPTAEAGVFSRQNG